MLDRVLFSGWKCILLTIVYCEFMCYLHQNKLDCSRDQFLHNLRGTAINGLYTGTGHHGCDWILAHKSIATEELLHFGRVFHLGFGAPELQKRCFIITKV